jgi:hypothetical protein
MVDSAARVAACPWLVDARRREPKGDSGDSHGPLRHAVTGAARRGQAVAGVAESAISYDGGIRRYCSANPMMSPNAGAATVPP